MREFGYVRIATAVPRVRAGAVQANLASMAALAEEAASRSCDIVVFPELCVTGYTCADLFQQRTLLEAAEAALAEFLEATAQSGCVHVLGVPVVSRSRLFNCAVTAQGGTVLGVVPKTFIAGHKEYYEPRWFASGETVGRADVTLCGQTAPFGTDLLFSESGDDACAFGVELCEDLWAPVPPSSGLALAGATILLNVSASNDLAGKADYRRSLVAQQSARCLAAYAYCSAGVGESTTDLVFGGHCVIAENGVVLAESERFQRTARLTVADVDIDFLRHERLHNVTYTKAAAQASDAAGDAVHACRNIVFEHTPATMATTLMRPVDSAPFLPPEGPERRHRCAEILAIQSTGLATRLEHTAISNVVIGLSGGLDSTLTLLVAREAFARLGFAPSGIHCLTMPCFGTSDRTRKNVERLCAALQVPLTTVDISEICRRHFENIGHDGSTHDVTFENAQARERTQVLMDKANMLHALVVGTGDLSELALGWCTFNGDHMSMYAVNAGVPKTLVRFLVEYFAEAKADAEAAEVLRDILATPISPELLPPDENGEISQETEAVIGPYELHDFFLYQVVRCGFRPKKILFLARLAFGDAYTAVELKKWLRVFYDRFFRHQFKRSCVPDGPKVGAIALSPRGDWRMPSDASPDEWLAELE